MGSSNFALLNHPSKWWTTAGSIWIQSTSGSSYAFGIYSSLLKSSQSYDQSTLDSVSVFKDVGANAGILSGLLFTWSSSLLGKHGVGGPWVVLVAGAAQCFVGYFMMWASVVGIVEKPPVALMCFYIFLAAHAQTFFNTADVVTGVENFPNLRGTSVGLMKGFLGLSGAILIQVYQTIFNGNQSSFILMLAILPSLVPLMIMWFIRILPSVKDHDKEYLNKFSIFALVLAGYLMVIIILEKALDLVISVRIVSFVILLLLLTVPWEIARRAFLRDTLASQDTIAGKARLPEDPIYPDISASIDDVHTRGEIYYQRIPGDEDGAEKGMLREKHLNLLQAMRTWEFWLIFLAMSCGMGSGLATVNNMTQIGESLGYTTVEISTLISLWSIWNFLGRFGAGYISDLFLRWKGYPRPLFMVITLATMSIGHVVIASGLPGALYAGSILVGVCYGSQWSLMPTVASEVFGLMHMGTIFNTISIASPVGSYLLSVRVVGYFYDLEASSDNSCTGTRCFMFSFFIMALVTLFGSVVALVLYFRKKVFYEEFICKLYDVHR